MTHPELPWCPMEARGVSCHVMPTFCQQTTCVTLSRTVLDDFLPSQSATKCTPCDPLNAGNGTSEPGVVGSNPIGRA
jgi:hypothetical protein